MKLVSKLGFLWDERWVALTVLCWESWLDVNLAAWSGYQWDERMEANSAALKEHWMAVWWEGKLGMKVVVKSDDQWA